jgi:hypothetical protein
VRHISRRQAFRSGKYVPEFAGAGSGALAAARDGRRHGGEVLRVGRMAKTERGGDPEHDHERGLRRRPREPLVEPEHRIAPV